MKEELAAAPPPPAEPTPAAPVTDVRATPLRAWMRRRGGELSLILLAGWALVAAAAPVVAPADPLGVNMALRFTPPTAAHWLGTDELGRDILSRLIFGARVSLQVGFASVLLAALAGVPAGLWAGYAQGRSGAVIMRTMDALLAIPAVLLAMATVAFLGASPTNVTLAIALVNVPRFARITRASVLSESALEYVLAAQAAGARSGRILFRTLLPNVTGPLLVQAALAAADAVILEASLSFLGLGIQPPHPSWGLMVETAKRYLHQAPWYAVAPGVVLVLLVLNINWAADAVQRLLDPQRRSTRTT